MQRNTYENLIAKFLLDQEKKRSKPYLTFENLKSLCPSPNEIEDNYFLLDVEIGSQLATLTSGNSTNNQVRVNECGILSCTIKPEGKYGVIINRERYERWYNDLSLKKPLPTAPRATSTKVTPKTSPVKTLIEAHIENIKPHLLPPSQIRKEGETYFFPVTNNVAAFLRDISKNHLKSCGIISCRRFDPQKDLTYNVFVDPELYKQWYEKIHKNNLPDDITLKIITEPAISWSFKKETDLPSLEGNVDDIFEYANTNPLVNLETEDYREEAIQQPNKRQRR